MYKLKKFKLSLFSSYNTVIDCLVNLTFKSYSIVTLVIFLVLYILIYYLLGSPSLISNNWMNNSFNFLNKFLNLTGLLNFFDLGNLSDKKIQTIITGTSNSLAVILSITSALFVFSHREQKSISPSASMNTINIKTVLGFIIVIVYTMLIGHNLSFHFNSHSLSGFGLQATEYYSHRLIIWVIFLIFSITLFITMVKTLFNSMSIDKMLANSIEKTYDTLKFINNFYKKPSNKEYLSKVYKRFNYEVESVFQNLQFVAGNNMNKEFEDNIKKLKKVSELLTESVEKVRSDTTKSEQVVLALNLLERDDKEFRTLYNSLLRNIMTLINFCYKNKEYSKAENVFDLYMSLYSEEQEILRKIFVYSLAEFLDSLDINDKRQVDQFCDSLDKVPVDDVLIIYKRLFIKLINKAEIQLLTNTVYRISNRVDDKAEYIIDPLQKAVVLIIIQSLIRSIEVSQYNATGFIVKFLVTNFQARVVQDVFNALEKKYDQYTTIFESKAKYNNELGEEEKYNDELDEEEKYNNELDEEEEYNNEVDEEVKVFEHNDATLDYCRKKAFILIFGQYRFATKQNLWFLNENPLWARGIEIKEEFEGCYYVNYIFEKVLKAKSKYGLLLFEDEKLIAEIKELIGLKEMSHSK